jgi:hypothetical protein
VTWKTRELPVDNLVVLGEDKGNVRQTGGLLVGRKPSRIYPNKTNLLVVKEDGTEFEVAGSSTLELQISDADIGLFMKLTYLGKERAGNNTYKKIEVQFFEPEPGQPLPDRLRNWPRYAETQARLTAETAQGRNKPKSAVPEDDDFPDFDQVPGPIKDAGGDDLPF